MVFSAQNYTSTAVAPLTFPSHLWALSISTAKPVSISCQWHQWPRSLKLQRQQQSPNHFHPCTEKMRHTRKGWKWKYQQIAGVVCQGHLGLQEVEQGQPRSQKRYSVANGSWGSRGRLFGKSNWTCVPKLVARELWLANQGRLSFLLLVVAYCRCNQPQAVWGHLLNAQPYCDLGCPKVLAEGCYSWRHDKVLMEMKLTTIQLHRQTP